MFDLFNDELYCINNELQEIIGLLIAQFTRYLFAVKTALRIFLIVLGSSRITFHYRFLQKSYLLNVEGDNAVTSDATAFVLETAYIT